MAGGIAGLVIGALALQFLPFGSYLKVLAEVVAGFVGFTAIGGTAALRLVK